VHSGLRITLVFSRLTLGIRKLSLEHARHTPYAVEIHYTTFRIVTTTNQGRKNRRFSMAYFSTLGRLETGASEH
jgi:hypothetical protein